MNTGEVLVNIDINRVTFDIDEEVLVDAEFEIYGEDSPATFDDPAEYAELEIGTVTIIGATLDNETIELTDEQKAEVIKLLDYDKLETLCWKEANRQKNDWM